MKNDMQITDTVFTRISQCVALGERNTHCNINNIILLVFCNMTNFNHAVHGGVKGLLNTNARSHFLLAVVFSHVFAVSISSRLNEF